MPSCCVNVREKKCSHLHGWQLKASSVVQHFLFLVAKLLPWALKMVSPICYNFLRNSQLFVGISWLCFVHPNPELQSED